MTGDTCGGREPSPLEQELLLEKIRQTRAEATKSEIDLAVALDGERDRQVKLGRIRHLRINDVISGSNTDKWLDALQHWERRDPGEDVTIEIYSPGGSVTDGLAIFDQLMRMRRLGTKVTTRGTGLVASMAAVLLQAGDERVLDSRAKLLIHEGSSTFQGTFSRGEQEDYRQFSTMLLDDILDILAERSTMTKRQISNKWSRKDWYLTAAEAVKLGFADCVE